eukprot:5635701-Alexandrium_andersonii.AAC.1
MEESHPSVTPVAAAATADDGSAWQRHCFFTVAHTHPHRVKRAVQQGEAETKPSDIAVTLHVARLGSGGGGDGDGVAARVCLDPTFAHGSPVCLLSPQTNPDELFTS